MSSWVLLATAVALAMDAFAVAIAAGMGLKTVSLRQTFRLAWHFGIFQALMPIGGWLLGASIHSIVEQVDHWTAFGLLLFVGAKMIFEALRGSESPAGMQDPTRGGSVIMLSVATSIDALAVGFSLSMLGVSIWWPALVIGITAAAFTAAGMHLGRVVGTRSKVNRYAEIAGGVILIGIGLAILHDHGVF